VLAVITKRRNLDFGRRSLPGSGSTPGTQWTVWVNPTAPAAAEGAFPRLGEPDATRRGDRSGTLMSHARPTVPLPIGSLANAVSLSAAFGPLITTAGSPVLLSPRCRPTSLAAIALTTVTTAAHKEQGATARPVTDPWAQRRLGRHRSDFSAHLITIPWIADDRTDDRAFGGRCRRRPLRRRKTQKTTFFDDRQHFVPIVVVSTGGKPWPDAALCAVIGDSLGCRTTSFGRAVTGRRSNVESESYG